MDTFTTAVMRYFRHGAGVLLLVALGACSGVAHRATIHAAHDADGAKVAEHLADRYYDERYGCEGLPAALCSGILMRVTKRGPGYNAWNPNPGSPIKNGVSFSWLREDSGFGGLAFSYANGFIRRIPRAGGRPRQGEAVFATEQKS